MGNRDTQAAWRYHNGTKHPGGFLMDYRHRFDPSNQPLLFKIYTDLEAIPLPLDSASSGVSALSAIAENAAMVDESRIPDLPALTRLLWFSAGITKKITYAWGEMLFRAAACTGALYHIELYVVCGNLPGLGAGVYHFAPHDLALRRLRAGDYRPVLVEASASEPSVAHAPAMIVYTDVFWRNAVKYQAREYRHAFWDSGTILSHTLAMAAAHRLPAKVVMGFVDADVNRLLDLDAEREAALVLVPIGYEPDIHAQAAPDTPALNLRTAPISDSDIIFPAITAMHEASTLSDTAEVASWRGKTPGIDPPVPDGQVFPLRLEGELPPDSIEEVIIRRGSTRKFSHEAISFQQLSIILNQATRGIPADFLEPPGATLNTIYLIVNAVDDLPSGAYVFHRDRKALELLKAGDFRERAGLLGLQQALPYDAGVNVYLMADLQVVLERYGNRGYRAAQLDASITAGRIYLAAYALGIGATGLTFFDDMVTEFFSPHARNKSAMFLIALGKKAGRK
jgi:SagB-type dehydrogenase family enzyme